MRRADFDAVVERIAGVEGWLTRDQARLLWRRACQCWDRLSGTDLQATMVEIGSFRGRSTIVLACAAPEDIFSSVISSVTSEYVAVIAIDPHAGGDRGPGEITPEPERGEADLAAFRANLAAAGIADRVRHVRKPSGSAHGDVAGELDLVYIDGAHRFGPARADVLQWGGRVRSGGTMLVHDSFSSVGVTLALLTTTLVDPSWRYLGRCGSLAEFRRDRLSRSACIHNMLRQLAELPWFVRNLVVKALLMGRLFPLARLLGHDDSDTPPF